MVTVTCQIQTSAMSQLPRLSWEFWQVHHGHAPILCSQCHGEVDRPQKLHLPKIIIDVSTPTTLTLSTYLTHPHLMKEMKLKILGSPLPTRVEDGEMEMDTLGPPQPPAAVMERKKSRVGWVSIALLSFPTPELPCSLHLAFVSFPHVERDSK